MGEVYRARDTRLGRDVAIKILPHGWVADPERKRRLLQEARAVSALNHPNIVTLHDIARDDGAYLRFGGSRTVESLAVLPISNATGDPANDYLSEGISASIINRLSPTSFGSPHSRPRPVGSRRKALDLDPDGPARAEDVCGCRP